MNSDLTSYQQPGHTEMGPQFKVPSERPDKRGIDIAIPGSVVYTATAPVKNLKPSDRIMMVHCYFITESHFQNATKNITGP